MPQRDWGGTTHRDDRGAADTEHMDPEPDRGRRPGAARSSSRLQQRLEEAPRRLVLIGVSVIALVLLVGFAQMIRTSDRAGRASLEERAVQRTVITQRFIEAYNADLEVSVLAHAGQALSGPAPTAEELALVSRMMRFPTAVLIDASGRVMQTFPEDPTLAGADLADRDDHLRGAVDGRATVTGVMPAPVGGEPVVDVAVPFETASGRRVLSAGYRVEDTPLGAYLANATVSAGEELYLVDDAGTIIASSEPTASPTLVAQDPDLAGVAMVAGSGTISSGADERFFTAEAIAGAPWRLIRVLPSEVLYEPAEAGRWTPWLLFGGFLVVGLASLVMLSSLIGQRDHERRHARRDPLTGLANRRSLDAALAARAADPSGERWGVLMVDVDHFKQVNDQHGHQRGDEVLAAVAASLVQSVRPTDVVGRWGGEEFMVVVPGASLATASELAERIRQAVADLRVGTIAVTVSIGFASTETSPADGLVDLADASLYRAKQTGRNRVVSLSPADAFPAMAVPVPPPPG